MRGKRGEDADEGVSLAGVLVSFGHSSGQIPLWSGEWFPCSTSVTLPLASISTFVMPDEAQTMPSPGIVTWPSCPIEFIVTEPSGMVDLDECPGGRSRSATERARPDPDDIRARHLCLRRAACRSERLHAKDAPPEEIVAAVRIVASGDALLAPAITRVVIEEFGRQSPAPAPKQALLVEELTPREREVLDLLARGLSNPEICEALVISEATAKTHVARILQKLDLRDRVQAVIYAYETGLVAPGFGR
jgi:DNA-binding CsgD family transcriptional regulator